MLCFLIFGSLFATIYGGVLPGIPHQFSMENGRIAGGNLATIRDAPYNAQLYSIIDTKTCGGSIISKTHVLTAAHCLSGTSASNWRIRVASTFSNMGGLHFNVARFVIHENYNAAKMDYDIALMFLEEAIPLNGDNMAIIHLPPQEFEVDVGFMAYVTGWGAIREGGPYSKNMQEVYIPIVSQKDCEGAYGASAITSRMICAGYLETGGKGPCEGDDGGPMTYYGLLIGITSWGYGCGRPGYPSVYTRVSYFRDWIDDQML